MRLGGNSSHFWPYFFIEYRYEYRIFLLSIAMNIYYNITFQSQKKPIDYYFVTFIEYNFFP